MAAGEKSGPGKHEIRRSGLIRGQNLQILPSLQIMIQCNTESLEGSPFSRLRLPSWLSDTGWSGVWLPLQLLPGRSNDYTKVMAIVF
ncbi:hypothetical protein TVAG_582580 [Trichomonas vaginalis G3]|uniref:Uncharacterized protein n=1 Tax=Trichomonas vaginalis (strain ATCC PRA-98 / G3) TaxID=412133 RepID=A2HAV1_TRIV3|nr:protein of unknown function, DUF4106 family [Trichomonas vaginalis G3]XP_051097945.1 protein of unknown function, DUF4106 family [Trichomonas vaginalis G3]XP_051097947.1 protein of unknown function, DUF4106 family [Trichomonas vaginalis G3]EAX64715.1 hypothetical protein TVAG_511550 [Trichomonas vaginalis G3]EAX68726.1 hypothetical protein TVAG_542550 [Trichomonas vaginalis G3]EAX73466.1 hypothetical protein TVAG_582580 [Trichomonas vaginalis G3]KAI5524760.1 protein of unknown function, DU|eukprot:XP_001277645.1 hypothetical protein [Trichomonas vaginalis G3]